MFFQNYKSNDLPLVYNSMLVNILLPLLSPVISPSPPPSLPQYVRHPLSLKQKLSVEFCRLQISLFKIKSS